MIQWDFDDPGITSQLEGVLDTITRFHQVVVVVQAGEDPTGTNANIDKWPGANESRTGLIVVGAMDVFTGRMYPFSQAGRHLTVNAPGHSECAIGEEDGYTFTTGTDVAAAQVAGLVAYLLSLRDLDEILRTSQSTIPLNMRWLLVANSKLYFWSSSLIS